MPFDLARNILDHLRILTERDTALLDIRAGNIDLEQIHRLIRKPLHNLYVLTRRMTADIDNDLRVVLLQERNVPFDKEIDARVLQSDRI